MDKDGMDAMRNEEETTVDVEPTTEDFRGEEEQKLDVEKESNEGRRQENGGASEQREANKLDDDTPGRENDQELPGHTYDYPGWENNFEVPEEEEYEENSSYDEESEIGRRGCKAKDDYERKEMRREKQRRQGKSQKQKRAKAKMENSLALMSQKVVQIHSGEEGTTYFDGLMSKSKKKSKVKPIKSNVTHLPNIEVTEPVEIDEATENKNKPKNTFGAILWGRSSKEDCYDSFDDEKVREETELKKSSESNETSKKNKGKGRKLRSPVICLLGHVGTGKTKLLDFIRKTHVQEEEVGGIIHRIGATMIPRETLREMTKDFSTFKLELPGLLVIDTPGHKSFRNLRSRGTSMCDIAVLVVDIMQGLEQQTIESMKLLRDNNKPFIVALNKVDRLSGWKSSIDNDVENTVQSQDQSTQDELGKKCREVIVQFAEECLNAALFYENPDQRTVVSMVPTSAITGDGIGNLLSLVASLCQTLMSEELVFSKELQATVLEVTPAPNQGLSVDVILANGELTQGDTIVMAGVEEPFDSKIQSLWTRDPLKDTRAKKPYVKHKSIKGAQAVKITGEGVEKARAGSPLFVAPNQNESVLEPLKRRAAASINQVPSSIETSDCGVYVQASKKDSLEAFLEYLTSIDVPYFKSRVGKVGTDDVEKASTMLAKDRQYATILALGVKVKRDAQKLAKEMKVKVFQDDIMYHVGEKFLNYRKKCQKALSEAVSPCLCEVLSISKESFEVRVKMGCLRVGTPLLAINHGHAEVGVVTFMVSSEDGSPVDIARANDRVTIQVIDSKVQVNAEDILLSRFTEKCLKLFRKFYKKDFSSEVKERMLELMKAIPHSVQK